MNYNEIKRLKFEDLLWLTFAILSLLNIFGDYEDREFLMTNNEKYRNISNRVFTITLIVTLFIYTYFFLRNYKAYEKAPESQKKLFTVKLLGSSFLIAGIIFLIYFQVKQNSFVGSPAL